MPLILYKLPEVAILILLLIQMKTWSKPVCATAKRSTDARADSGTSDKNKSDPQVQSKQEWVQGSWFASGEA